MLKKLQKCPICGSGDIINSRNSIRDSEAIGVAHCQHCQHTFLNTFDHIDNEYFEKNEFLESKKIDDHKVADSFQSRLNHFAAENRDRFERINQIICNKNVLEFGCGAGGLLRLIEPLCKSITGIERTESFVKQLEQENYQIYPNLEDIKEPCDVILSFHVFEHLPDPISILKTCYEKLKPGGMIYIEVPNLNDALLSLYDIPEYHEFYYFKDHLHYFTRATLNSVFQQAGIYNVTITGHNRFGLDNHLYWLRHGKPGGHVKWNFLADANEAYMQALAKNDYSDTLIAQAIKK